MSNVVKVRSKTSTKFRDWHVLFWIRVTLISWHCNFAQTFLSPSTCSLITTGFCCALSQDQFSLTYLAVQDFQTSPHHKVSLADQYPGNRFLLVGTCTFIDSRFSQTPMAGTSLNKLSSTCFSYIEIAAVILREWLVFLPIRCLL